VQAALISPYSFTSISRLNSPATPPSTPSSALTRTHQSPDSTHKLRSQARPRQRSFILIDRQTVTTHILRRQALPRQPSLVLIDRQTQLTRYAAKHALVSPPSYSSIARLNSHATPPRTHSLLRVCTRSSPDLTHKLYSRSVTGTKRTFVTCLLVLSLPL
jgi:hypothetical protein